MFDLLCTSYDKWLNYLVFDFTHRPFKNFKKSNDLSKIIKFDIQISRDDKSSLGDTLCSYVCHSNFKKLEILKVVKFGEVRLNYQK